MNYHISKLTDMSFDKAIEKVTAELKEEGFGVLTEIDVKETLKKKLDVDFRRYQILGACNPPFAHKALTAEEDIGILLPCNVVVQETKDNKVKVSAVNAMEAMKPVENKELEDIANQVTDRLKKVIDRI